MTAKWFSRDLTFIRDGSENQIIREYEQQQNRIEYDLNHRRIGWWCFEYKGNDIIRRFCIWSLQKWFFCFGRNVITQTHTHTHTSFVFYKLFMIIMFRTLWINEFKCECSVFIHEFQFLFEINLNFKLSFGLRPLVASFIIWTRFDMINSKTFL